jgi:hypothetical protein
MNMKSKSNTHLLDKMLSATIINEPKTMQGTTLQ